jgi:CheY-like chemotaxis protein
MTAGQAPSRREIADAGVRASLGKPVRTSELRSALVAALGGPADVPAPASSSGPGLGIRVLVVEDNQVNQLVATGLLESLGCTVDVASDGIEAVERLTGSHEYAAVLMDCRMPRLDGFDATRQVRAQEPADRRVPIIAMTASALEGERERCLAAGMDDYLTKPVDPAELERVLREWVRPVGRHLEAGVLDPDRIALLDELRKDGVTFFERTAASFTGRVGEQLTAIRSAVESDQATSLLTAAHQLKGSALNLGLPRVARAAARLEALGLDGHTTGARPILAELVAEVDLAVGALQRATSRNR